MSHLENLHKNLFQLLKQGRFTDLTINIEGSDYRCHRVVLAGVPGYFSDLLNLDFQESEAEYIEIRTRDPDNIFPLILEFVYTGRKDWVTLKNALSVYMLSVYLQISELQRAAEEKFQQMNKEICIDALKNLNAYPAYLLPDSFINFMASSFNHLSTNVDFLALPQAVIIKVIVNPALKIQSDVSLAKFVTDLHKRQTMDPDDRKRVSQVIQWPFLLDNEWAQIDWRPFLSERERSRHMEHGRRWQQIGPWTPLKKVLACLNLSKGNAGLNLLERYVQPSWVQWFTLVDAWFGEPVKFTKISLHPMVFDPKSTENELKAYEDHAVFVKEFQVITSSSPGQPLLFVAMQNFEGRTRSASFSPKNRNNKFEYEGKLDERQVFKSIAFRIDVQNTKNFRWTSTKIVGFTC